MYIGIDIGGSFIKAGLLNDNFEILKKQSIKTNKGTDGVWLCQSIADLAIGMLKSYGAPLSDIKSIGLACPGVTDYKNGLLVFPPNLNIRNFDIVSEMKKHFNIPVKIENDANCAAVCQFNYVRKTHDISDMAVITIGTGIGGGVIVDKKLVRGQGLGGEIGHMKISLGGRKCSCGCHGCLEAYASADALAKQTKRAALKYPNSEMGLYIKKTGEIDPTTAFSFMKKGDPTAVFVIDKYTEYLSLGVSNIINMFSPQAIYIGGGVSNQKEALISPLRKKVYKKMLLPYPIIIDVCENLNDAGVIGAAMISQGNY